MYDFMEIIHKDTKEIKIVDELSDELFDNGYRFKQHVPNSQVDIVEIDAKREEETLERMANSSSDPCYWDKEHILSSGKYNNDNESDPIYRPPLEIY